MGNTRSIETDPGKIQKLAVHLTVSSPLIPFGLLAFAVVLFAVVTILVIPGPPAEPQDRGFFADPLPAILMIIAAISVIASGATALIDLIGRRLTTRSGRWAFRLAIVNCLLMPVITVAVLLAAAVLGLDLDEGWGQPVIPLWIAIGLIAAVLGAFAPEFRRRGLLVIPLMIGAFALTFAIGEMTVPH